MDLSNVRIREHFGLLSNDSRTGQFNFLVSPPKSRAGIEKNDYILVDHALIGEACQILAIISEITSYEEIAGSTINERKGKMLATAQIIGGIDLRNDNKPLNKILVPPTPGSRVYIPLKNFVQDILNRNLQGEPYKTPIQIGNFEGTSAEEENNKEIKCFIDAQEITTKHTIISSVTGAGKTQTAKKIVKSVLQKTQTPIIVFDAYGEYASKKNSAKIISEKEALLKEIKKNKLTTLNGQGLTLEEKRTNFTEALKTILELRLKEKIDPVLVVIEEAENLKGTILEEAITQGNKIGLSLCLITTQPSEIGGKILPHVSNQLIGKTTDTSDIERLSMIAGTTNNLTELTAGEWILSGINTNRTMKIRTE